MPSQARCSRGRRRDWRRNCGRRYRSESVDVRRTEPCEVRWALLVAGNDRAKEVAVVSVCLLCAGDVDVGERSDRYVARDPVELDLAVADEEQIGGGRCAFARTAYGEFLAVERDSRVEGPGALDDNSRSPHDGHPDLPAEGGEE